MVTRTLNLPDETNEALEKAAKERGTSVEELVRDLIGLFDERRKLVEEALADVAAGKTVDNAAVKAWLTSWGDDDEKDPPSCPA